MLIADNPYNDWYAGLAIGFAVVVVVVVLVAVILTLVERIGSQAESAVDGVEAVRTGTTPLWAVQYTNAAAVGILNGARTARQVVTARLRGGT